MRRESLISPCSLMEANEFKSARARRGMFREKSGRFSIAIAQVVVESVQIRQIRAGFRFQLCLKLCECTEKNKLKEEDESEKKSHQDFETYASGKFLNNCLKSNANFRLIMDCVYNYCFRFEILPCLFTYELTFFYGFYALGEKKKNVFTGYCLLLF